MKIFLTGVSGTGKSSIARALAARGIATIDVDDISHWENKETGEHVDWQPGRPEEWHAAHSWSYDIEHLKQLVAGNENVVVVGGVSDQEEFYRLFDKSFVLDASPETVITRIHTRTDNDFGKHPLELARVLNWQKNAVADMRARGAVVFNAERPLEEIVEEIQSYFK